MTKDARLDRWLLLAFAVLQFATPPLAFAGGFDAATAGNLPEVSDPNSASPAGFAFAIWGPIFAGAVASALLQLGRRGDDRAIASARWPTMLGYSASIAWMVVAPTPFGWATVPLIGVMFAALGRALGTTLKARNAGDRLTGWLILAPLGLYVGWLTAAVFVNAADVLPALLEQQPMAGSTLGLLVLLLIAATSWYLIGRYEALPAYVVALAWAVFGIIVANLGRGGSKAVLVTSFITLILVAIRYAGVRRRFARQ